MIKKFHLEEKEETFEHRMSTKKLLYTEDGLKESETSVNTDNKLH